MSVNTSEYSTAKYVIENGVMSLQFVKVASILPSVIVLKKSYRPLAYTKCERLSSLSASEQQQANDESERYVAQPQINAHALKSDVSLRNCRYKTHPAP